jgi:hypothetical protein
MQLLEALEHQVTKHHLPFKATNRKFGVGSLKYSANFDFL